MPDTTGIQFLAEGIGRYAQALETIAVFETLLRNRLQRVAQEYSSKSFTPTSAQLTSGVGGNVAGKWIWAGRQGRLQSKGLVWLELGLWWNEDQVAYYCNFCDDNNKALPFTYGGNHPRVDFKKWSKSARLFMLTSKERYEAMDEDFQILLNELTSSFS